MSEKKRYTVELPEELHEDAKRNTEHGELAEEVRATFRRVAYGAQAARGRDTELERTQAKLRETRARMDMKRHERTRIDAEIQNLEQRATRLEELADHLQDKREAVEAKKDAVESVLLSGQRVWPTYVKNNFGVTSATAEMIVGELREEHPDVPPEAFDEPTPSTGNTWDR